jgi:peptidoglycan hydrolase CwlO-like protein
MGDINEIVKTSGGLFGSAIAAVTTVAYLLRRFLLSDKVASATAQGNVDVIQRLTEIADRAERRAEAAEKRADDAQKERNEAVHEIGALREQVRQLTTTVDDLRKEISGYKQQLR